ncbi:MAG: hypothetical protein A2Z20_11500 [Bdellovibrionales bacterium RBG_16_40_8]|nr:MAG: hypothetical protein A2Z20_11500 [Bdellovibrionales bacterium RBG_16_40_8]
MILALFLHLKKTMKIFNACLIMVLTLAVVAMPAQARTKVSKKNKKKIVSVTLSPVPHKKKNKNNNNNNNKTVERKVASVAFASPDDELMLEPLSKKQHAKLEKAEKNKIATQKDSVIAEEIDLNALQGEESTDEHSTVCVKIPAHKPSLKNLLKKYEKQFARDAIEE